VRLLVFTVLGCCLLVLAFGIGLGGQVGAMLALTVIFLGAALHVVQPLIDWVRKP
jgi:hypothetical protein